MTKRLVYFFDPSFTEGNGTMKELLGGKGAGLAEMCRLGIPVPSGFTITTEACTYFFQKGERFPPELEGEVCGALAQVEKIMEARFGDPRKPLLVSVRSGARASMPGMMDTILNLGLTEASVGSLTKNSGNKKFAEDCYKRLREMYQGVVGDPLPEDPWKQLWGAVGAVFRSWNNKRAIEYRRIHGIPDDWGTACNIQAMVFGNLDDASGTGVAFTRNPATGEKKLYGEFLANAQGEDIVAGTRTPDPIEKMRITFPQCYKALVSISEKLESHCRDMQDIEFTIQKGKLWMLQTRNGKRTAQAAVKIAVEMVGEKLISKEEAIHRVEARNLDQLLHPTIDPKAKRKSLTKGLAASPGAAVGRIVFNVEDAVSWAERKEPVILVRIETSPDDIHGMVVAQGILTARGGITSHAGVVARGMGKPCVVGCGELEIHESGQKLQIGSIVIKAGDFLTLDGATGEVFAGALPTLSSKLSGEFETLMQWADGVRKLEVWANADTPKDAKRAREFGAQGIGLCRTEHMFFEPGRIEAMQRMIVAETVEERRRALAQLEPMQKQDFKEIFRVMDGLPVIIRLLDPPLHEFLPKTEVEIRQLANQLRMDEGKLTNRIEFLKEMNPMLGHRGCRLAITYPEIYEMQVEAILTAACEIAEEENIKVIPKIEIPLVADAKELKFLKEICEKVGAEVFNRFSAKFRFEVGTMIELPRACLIADELAEVADFFSFGTNDLTQTTFGLSRDDAFKFLPQYREAKIVKVDPFESIDTSGVGQLIEMTVKKARKVKPDLEIGICGEHGGDPASIHFCHQVGLNYVSCSPYRVPIAILAAAQAGGKPH